MNSELQDTQRVAYQDPPPPAAPRAPGKSSVRAYKSPVLAALLSMMPGLGQVYVGYYPQGFMYIIIVAMNITFLSLGVGGMAPLFGVFLAFFWIYNMIDASRRANHYNRAIDGLTGEILPDDFEVPGLQGSLPIGVVLVVAGTLLFLNRKFGLSMNWLEDWWPLGLVIAGVWLIVRARRQAD